MESTQNTLLEQTREVYDEVMKSGAATAEVFGTQSIVKQVLFSSSKIVDLSTSEELGFGIRYQKNSQMVFQTIDGYNKETLEDKLSSILNSSVPAFSSKIFEFASEKPQMNNEFLNQYDSKIDRFSLTEIVEHAQTLRDSVQAHKVPIYLESGVVATKKRDIAIVNSNDLSINHSDSFIMTQARFIAGLKAEIIFEKNYRRIYRNLTDALSIDFDAELAESKEYTKPKRITDNQILTVVFDTSAMCQIGDLILRPLLSNSINPKNPDLPRQISPLIEVREDANDATRLGSSPFDHEGIQTKELLLYREGMLKNKPKDLIHAGNQSPSGNTLRGIPDIIGNPIHRIPPSIILTNLLIKPTKQGDNQLQEGITNGVRVNGIASLNYLDILTGDFELRTSEAFNIKNGKESKAVGKISIFGNIYELLGKISGIGDEVDSGYFSKIPSMRVDHLRILGKPRKTKLGKIVG